MRKPMNRKDHVVSQESFSMKRLVCNLLPNFDVVWHFHSSIISKHLKYPCSETDLRTWNVSELRYMSTNWDKLYYT